MKNVQNRARFRGGSRKEISTQQTLPDQHANTKSFTFKEADGHKIPIRCYFLEYDLFSNNLSNSQHVLALKFDFFVISEL